MDKIKFSLLLSLSLFSQQVIAVGSATWTSTSNAELTATANWNSSAGPVPGSATIATFDSSIPSIATTLGTATLFAIDSFNFPNSAASFNFTFTGPGAVEFNGAGITGTNTDTTINATNTTTMAIPQIFFNQLNGDSSFDLGNASFVATNSGIMSSSTISQITLNNSAYGSSPFFEVTNSGTITGTAPIAQFFFPGDNFATFNPENATFFFENTGSATISGNNSSGQLVVYGAERTVTFGGVTSAVNLTFSNTSSSTIQSPDVDAGQMVLAAADGAVSFLASSATLAFTNSESTILGHNNNGNAGQMVVNGQFGTVTFGSATSEVNLSFINDSTSTISAGYDAGQMVCDGKQGHISLLASNARLSFTNSDSTISAGYDAGQMVFVTDHGTVSYSVGANSTIDAINSGTISTTGSSGYSAQILFDGSTPSFFPRIPPTIGGNATITATNTSTGTITSLDPSHCAQIYFYYTNITGAPTLQAINQQISPTLPGIVFDGNSTTDGANIVLQNSSLVVKTPVTIGFVTGDASSSILLNDTLHITALSSTGSFPTTISGNGGFTQDIGSGNTLTLTSVNTYSGPTLITSGTLALSGTGSIASSSLVTIADTFDISQVTSGATIGDLAGLGSVVLGSQTLTAGGVNGSVFGGVISGTGNFIAAPVANMTLTLTSPNTYAGTTGISGGILALSGSGSIGSTSLLTVTSTFDISQATTGATIGDLAGSGSVVLGGNTLTAGGNSGSTFAGVISGTGNFIAAPVASKTLTLTSANTYAGTTGISGGTLALSGSGSIGNTSLLTVTSTFDISQATSGITIGDLAGSGSVVLGGNTLTAGGNSGSVFGGEISGTGNFIAAPVANMTLTLTSPNTYAGTTGISGGILALSGSGSIGSTSLLTVTSTFDISQVTSGATIGDLAGSGSVVLGGNTLTAGGNSGSTFAGVISGTGNFIAAPVANKTLTLTSANTYAGTTGISGGTLALSGSGSIGNTSLLTVTSTFDISQATSETTIGDLAGAGTVTLGSNKTFTVGGNNGSTFSGLLTGASISLVKQGSGTLTLSGSISGIASTSINAGALSVSGTLPGTVTIGAGGVLQGAGTVGNIVLLTSGSKVAPGSPTTTLHTGSAMFANGSIFAVNIDAAGNAAALNSSGTIEVSSATLQVIESAGSYVLGTSYPIMTAPTITGATEGFSITSTAGHNYSLSLEESFMNNLNNMQLFLTLDNIPLSSGISTAGLKGNNLVIGNYLNSLASYPPLQPALTSLGSLPSLGLNAALEAISPARNAFATFTLQNTAFTFSETLSSRQTDQRFLRARPQDKGQEVAALIAGPIMHQTVQTQGKAYSVWGSAIGSFAHENAQQQTPSFAMSTGGFLVGYDNYHYHNALLGGSLGYAYVDVHDKKQLGKQYLNDYVASVYSSVYVGDLFFDFALWGGYHHGHSERKISFTGFNETAKARLSGWQVIPHFLLGYDYKMDALTLEPFAQFDWAVNFERAFSETGASALDIHQKAHTSSLLRSEIGLALSKMYVGEERDIFVARGHLSYVNKKMFGTGKVTAAIVGAPGGSFIVETLTGTQNLAAPGLEVFYETSTNIFFSLTWEGEFGDGYRANNAVLKVGKAF